MLATPLSSPTASSRRSCVGWLACCAGGAQRLSPSVRTWYRAVAGRTRSGDEPSLAAPSSAPQRRRKRLRTSVARRCSLRPCPADTEAWPDSAATPPTRGAQGTGSPALTRSHLQERRVLVVLSWRATRKSSLSGFPSESLASVEGTFKGSQAEKVAMQTEILFEAAGVGVGGDARAAPRAFQAAPRQRRLGFEACQWAHRESP
jgi:hypothetical protein